MALAYQYNKSEIQRIQQLLKVRETALPILKNKESALRAEVLRLKKQVAISSGHLEVAMHPLRKNLELFSALTVDFRMSKLEIGSKKVAGVLIPVFESVEVKVSEFSEFARGAENRALLKLLQEFAIEKCKTMVLTKQLEVLEKSRKKTTQKVNLYEKVQIPEYKEAITKIKKVLEDTTNLERASQKILKKRQEAAFSMAQQINLQETSL